MTSIHLPADQQPVTSYDPGISAYEQGRTDRSRGWPFGNGPYITQGNISEWQRGWSDRHNELKGEN